MATYGNPHTLPPVRCASNLPTWTQDSPTVTAGVTPPRVSHINDLRTRINAELARRGLPQINWTQDASGTVSTITAWVTPPRASHINDLRTAIVNIKTGDCSDGYYCPGDTTGTITWSQDSPTVIAGATLPRASHINDLRTRITNATTSCICESEQCSFCADCGFQYNVCSHNGVACNDSQSGSNCGYMVPTGVCASANVGGTYPKKSATCSYVYCSANSCTNSSVPEVSWDGTVPWVMGSTPPGTSWSNYNYCPSNWCSDYNGGTITVSGRAWGNTPWSCMCNPYYNCSYTYCHR